MKQTRVSFQKGLAYRRMGLWDDAAKEFQVALEDSNIRCDAMRELSACLVAMGRADRAEDLYRQFLEAPGISSEERGRVLADLADLYTSLGEVGNAIEVLRTIERESPMLSPDLAEQVHGLSRRLGASLSRGPGTKSHGSDGVLPRARPQSKAPKHTAGQTQYSDPRRRAPRVRWSHPVHYSFDQSTWSTGYFRDVSTDGMFVLTHEPTPIGSLVFIRFDLPGADESVRMEIIGQVVRQGNGTEASGGVVGMGVLFVSVPDEHERRLRGFINRLLEEQGRREGRTAEIRFHCDGCQTILTAPPSMSGVSVHCVCGTPVMVPFVNHHPLEDNPLHGFHIAGCRIDSVIGAGGAATVYKGHHLTLDIPVAVKILREVERDRSSDKVERFVREARAIARIQHPNVVSVMNAGEESGYRFLVMPYVPGRSLGDILKATGSLALNDFIWVFLHVCRALSAAHRRSIVHGDVKPENILISRGGTAMLADFGLVRLLSDRGSGSADELIVGSPLYISPEQITGKDTIDLRSDIYSLGATMYHALVGRPAFTGTRAVDVMLKHVHETLIPPSTAAPMVPKDLSEIVVKAMAKQPAGRFQSVDQIQRALTEFSRDLIVQGFRPLSRLLQKRGGGG